MVKCSLFDHGTNVLNNTSVSRAVISHDQIVVDGLGNTYDSQSVIFFLGKLRNLVGGILRIISASIEKITYIMSLKYFEDSLVVLITLELEAASVDSEFKIPT